MNMGFGCYLVLLAVLGLYLRAKGRANPRERFAMAGGLLVLTLPVGVGVFSVSNASQLKGRGSTVSYSRPSKHGA